MIYPLPEFSNKNTISKDKIFQFETLFCHVTTTEILHMNFVCSLVNAKSLCWDEPEKGWIILL